MREPEARSFHDAFTELFDTKFHRIYRVLDRFSGDPELAGDLAQEAFLRLYRRGSLPDAPDAWLVSVGLNLLRNAQATTSRRNTTSERVRVRTALDRLSERERGLLLLRAEGYSYRDIAVALSLTESSIGTLLARARAAFKKSYEDTGHAS
jgi:RNA polymerase sigma-70 factor (ECF subfamily)